jgi:hypothetical protein
MRFVKLNICAILLCCAFAACLNNDEKKWEPEVALSLAYFELDVSEYLRLDTFVINEIFQVMRRDWQTAALKRAIRSLDSLEVPVKSELPLSVRSNMDNFLMDRNPMDATQLLETLMSTFREKDLFVAINRFTYEIVTEAGERDDALKQLVDIAFAKYDSIYIYEAMEVDISDFSKNVEQIQGIKLQSFLKSQLQVDADIQVHIRDISNADLEKFTLQMPAFGESETRGTLQVYDRDKAQGIIRSMNGITISVFSRSLGLTLENIKNLHKLKINISMSLMVKIAINSNDAEE